MTVWLTADWHIWHDNIIALTGRPFRTQQQMHETLITNYQRLVADDDVVWFLGDLTLRGPKQIRGVQRIVEMLPGQKHFVLGNHDRLKVQSYLRMGFLSVHTHQELRHGGQDYPVVHDPKDALAGTDRLICGHVHEKWKTRANPYPTVNIGVDVWDFEPVRLADVVAALPRILQASP